MQHVVLFGKPGAGKGTLSTKMAKQGAIIISGSGVLRENSQDESAPYYKEAKHALDFGQLIDSKILNEMMKGKIEESLKSGKSMVFDGYPRTMEQAEFLMELMGDTPFSYHYIEIDNETVIERIMSRVVCSDCQSSFSTLDGSNCQPKKEDICDHCGGQLIKRKDDNREILSIRLKEYDEKTQPILDILKSKAKPVSSEEILL